MYKFKIGQKILVSASVLIWAVWAAFAIYFADTISGDAEAATLFFMVLTWSFIIYVVMLFPIISPDMNLVSKKVTDDNRLKVVEIRRTMFAIIQLMFVFLACGTSVSLFYPEWKMGIGVTVAIYVAALGIALGWYFYDFNKITKGQKVKTALATDSIVVVDLVLSEDSADSQDEAENKPE